jgi:hypothetical protein
MPSEPLLAKLSCFYERSEFPAFFGEASNCIEPDRFFGGKILVSK